MSKETFFEFLNLPEETRNKLSLSRAVYFIANEQPAIRVYVKVNNVMLTPTDIENICVALTKPNLIPSCQFNISNFYIENYTIEHETYELYEFVTTIISFLVSDSNIANMELVKENDFYYLKISNDLLFNKLLPVEGKLNVLLHHFSLINKDLKIILDEETIEKKKEIVLKHKNAITAHSLINSNNIAKQPYEGTKLVKPLDPNEQENIYFEGKVFAKETKQTRREGSYIYKFSLAKGNQAVNITAFGPKTDFSDIIKGSYVRMYGTYKYNNYARAMEISSNGKYQFLEQKDVEIIYQDTKATKKRKELHVHTKMSVMDGANEVNDYKTIAQDFGIDTIAIVDHNSAQSHPDGAHAISKDFKVIFGVEFDVYDDLYTKIVINPRSELLIDAEMVFFDLETTSLSPLVSEIIEFGGVKVKDGNVTARLQLFIKPEKEITEYTTNITGITNEMVVDACSIEEALPKIIDFFGDAILVAHNATFDYSFLNSFYHRYGFGEVKNPIIDSMKISWLIHPRAKNHRLGTLARNETINYDEQIAHRADYDAEVLAKTFENLLQKIFQLDIRNLEQLNGPDIPINDFIFRNHVTVLAKNQVGLKSLYKLVSAANTTFFNTNIRKKQSNLPLSVLLKPENRKNLLIGSGCTKGMLFEAMLYDSKNLDKIVKFYDYIEVFPPSAYSFLTTRGMYSKENIELFIKKLVQLGKDNHVMVVATGDVHYAKPEDKLIRDIYIGSPGLKNSRHPLYNWKNPHAINPDQNLKSTTEMLDEFIPILGEELAKEIVVDNSIKLAAMIDQCQPLKDKLYTPRIPEADEEFTALVKENTKKLYGDNVNPLIQKRIDQEMAAIKKHGFGIIYYLSSIAVRKSLEDGYLVGSRGSVGSSIAATLSEITEVNPLPAHYLCSNCQYHEFAGGTDSGFDLKDKKCPKCGEMMHGEGQNIPFETFLGFNADKVPDIDLNFSREHQANIHQFIKHKLGEKNVFRAGTISTVANKTAYGYVRKYIEQMGKEQEFTPSDINYLAYRVEGVKRTTGQHPGGLIVIPNEFDVEDFTPINYPGNDETASITTHFDYHSFHDNVLKLDFLGHLDPSSIRMLQNLTKIDPHTIPMNDPEVISLFKNNNVLNIIENYTGEDLGIIGLPEFGTTFVRSLVHHAKPQSFSDLVRISGLSHGTDVWIKNAKDVIDSKKAVLSEVISVRDDIMVYLISKKIDNLVAFKIMEQVRKGQSITEEQEQIMSKHNVPQWYIESCKKIKYMFPKAHAVAYVMMAYRIAWYKINYPLEYYATFFTKRDTEWDLSTLFESPEVIKTYQDKVKQKGYEASEREKSISGTYDIVLELLSRGYKISPLSLAKSRTNYWIVDTENKALIPPFTIIEGFGNAVASKLVETRNERMFSSIPDFMNRASFLNATIKEKFSDLGVLKVLGEVENDSQLKFSFE